MDCARLNCSHGGPEDLLRRAREVRAASARAGRSLGLLFDLQGPKLRLSGETGARALEPGENVTFTGRESDGDDDRVVVDFPGFARLCTDRSDIVIGDGVPRLAVTGAGEDEVRARVDLGGPDLGPQGRQRHLLAPRAARDHREGPRRPRRRRRGGRRLHRALVRALGRRPRAAAGEHALARLAGPDDRQDREGRGLRAPRRDPRRRRRRDGRPRRLRRRGGRSRASR